MNSLQGASRIFKAFKKGGPSFGAWQMLPSSNNSRAISRSGVDWICADMEHGNIDDGQMHELVAAIAATGVSPLVRIAANEAWMVKRALDAGAHGIVVPLIYTVDDAKRLVASTKFPPLGHRGFGSPFSPQNFTNESMTHYLQHANDSLVTIVQIETASALACVREIAAIPGVDCLLIGPFDLGNNIGRPILEPEMHDELKQAIEDIKVAAHAEGKKVGIYCTSGEQSREYAERGFDMISIAADILAIQAYFSETLATASGKGSGEQQKGSGYDGR
ncbi:Phosphoenolpyruvate/pyruvate domain-containing protein [Pleomassaria siparia CBS 279.74]|uniref:Phosphoenolpyruvate/pyruvate domain-containing protein n=1 Tax=Pleomassaria siparia CBS 279.74 TaxID=1314801 RepID=A0A6G1K2D7_9PLEO|nr:Phosphoenolpyruvate/pyruvate domain-containing protein [Pleomassaria siparia CBS 279.74]